MTLNIFYMNSKNIKWIKYCLSILLLLLTRLVDIVFTYQYTPNLSKEGNPLVVYFNFGWAEILICQFVGIILISWLLYSHIFNKSNMNPEVNGLSFNSFALHQYYGAEYLSISKKWNVFLDYPKGFQRNKYILGWVLPQAAIVVGLQLVIIHIFLRENQTFRSNYRIILPWIYVLLVLSVFLCFYLYMRVKFINYKRANRSDVQIL